MAYIQTSDQTIEFTATGDEQYSLSGSATKNQVEVGDDITDHVKNEPLGLGISGQITGNDAMSKLTALLNVRNARQIVKFVGRYSALSIVITSLTYKFGVAIANGFEFDLSFDEIKTSQSKVVQITSIDPKVISKIVGKTSKGKKSKDGTTFNVSDYA